VPAAEVNTTTTQSIASTLAKPSPSGTPQPTPVADKTVPPPSSPAAPSSSVQTPQSGTPAAPSGSPTPNQDRPGD
jgi:hypothetical protein